MIMGTYHEIDSLQALEQIKSLAFEDASVAFTCSGMNSYDHHIGLLFLRYPVNDFLSHRYQGSECHSFPEKRRKPALDVRIGEADYGNVQAMTLQCDIFLEIRLSIVVSDCIRSKERNLHRSYYTVIYRMAGLNVMVTHYDSIIADIFDHTCKKML